MSDPHVPGGQRLQKVMAHAGVGSRRVCEDLIARGRVTVDGQVVTSLGTRIDPATAVLHVDGTRVQLDASKVTLALYKPPGVVSTMVDERGRPALAQYVADRPERLFHIGRLDRDTEGVILLSNDGELAHRLMHPGYEIPKTYVAIVKGRVEPWAARKLRRGIELEDGPARADRVTIKDSGPAGSIVEITLHSGRNRIVRRIMEEVGHPVMELVRTKFGTVEAGRLKPGKTRVVAGSELGALMRLVDL